MRALGYCHLLMLARSDFHSLLAEDPALKSEMDRMARERTLMNATALEEDATSTGDDNTSRHLDDAARNLTRERGSLQERSRPSVGSRLQTCIRR